MFRKVAALLVGAALVAACAGPRQGPSPQFRSDMLKPIARPGDIVAVELAFSRMSEEQGRWAAFREYADDSAVMFVPEKVNAKDWLKGRESPAEPLIWEPYEVWSSCDGSLGVSRGAWESGDRKGWFTTVWKRYPDGKQRWVLDHGDYDAKVSPPPELIEAHVAECPKEPLSPTEDLVVAVPGEGTFFGGASDDGTLRWGGRVDQWGGRIVTIDVWNGSAYQRVLHQTIAPPTKN